MHDRKNIRIILSGGGTGGHIFPALAIARELEQRLDHPDILFVGASSRMEMEKVPQAGYRIIGLPVSAFHRRLTWKNLLFPFRLVASMQKAKRIIKNFQPHLVVGTGGFASGPVLRVASRRGIPTLLQEQNSYPGVTNRLLAARVDRICVAYEGLERYFPADKIVLTGNPVRQDLADLTQKREKASAHFQLKEGAPVILVIGGSQGARTLNREIQRSIEKLREASWNLIWQTGMGFFEEATRVVSDYQAENVKVFPFIREMDLAYAAADLVVSRAGAITLSELAVAGRPALLVPYPHAAEDHQTRNARRMVENNAACLVPDEEAGDHLFQRITDLLSDPESLRVMAQNMKQLARPGATAEIAELAEKLIQDKR